MGILTGGFSADGGSGAGRSTVTGLLLALATAGGGRPRVNQQCELAKRKRREVLKLYAGSSWSKDPPSGDTVSVGDELRFRSCGSKFRGNRPLFIGLLGS
jgi:hypothetical protein